MSSAGIVMTETGIIEREVAVEAMIGMNVTSTVGETKTITTEAEAVVPVLITRVVVGHAMMMNIIVEAAVDQLTGLHLLIYSFLQLFLPHSLLQLCLTLSLIFLIVAPLHDAVLVLERVLPYSGALLHKGVHPLGKAHGVKVQQIVAVMDVLLPRAVYHHAVALKFHEALPLGIRMVM